MAEAMLRKLGAAEGIGGHDPDQTTASLPQTAILTTPAAGKRGPIGTAPRTNYSRVNTGTAGIGDVSSAQKSAEPPETIPKIAFEETMHTPRPRLHEMIEMAKQASSASVLANAAAVMNGTRKLASEMSEEDKKREEEKKKKQEKDAGADCKVASETCEKIASVLDMLAEEKLAEGPGEGPGALHVMETAAHPALPQHHGQAQTQIPAPTMGKGAPPSDPKTQMANDIDKRPGGETAQQTALPGDKHAAARGLDILQFLKQAEDAINPAKISAGGAAGTALQRSETLEHTIPVPAHASLIATNESSRDFTRGQAKSQEREDLKKVLDEPALSASADSGLRDALTHNSGSKVASVQQLAASAYLQKLAAALP